MSFSGVKIIMMGVAKFLADKEAILRLEFDDPKEVFLIKGKFIRSEAVEGRKELVSLVVLFDESLVPMGYKIRVNDFISAVRPETRGGDKGIESSGPKTAQMKAEAKPAQSPQKAPPKKDDWPSPDEVAASAPKSAPAAKPTTAKSADDFDLNL
jgi:hypothetical protein